MNLNVHTYTSFLQMAIAENENDFLRNENYSLFATYNGNNIFSATLFLRAQQRLRTTTHVRTGRSGLLQMSTDSASLASSWLTGPIDWIEAEAIFLREAETFQESRGETSPQKSHFHTIIEP